MFGQIFVLMFVVFCANAISFQSLWRSNNFKAKEEDGRLHIGKMLDRIKNENFLLSFNRTNDAKETPEWVLITRKDEKVRYLVIKNRTESLEILFYKSATFEISTDGLKGVTNCVRLGPVNIFDQTLSQYKRFFQQEDLSYVENTSTFADRTVDNSEYYQLGKKESNLLVTFEKSSLGFKVLDYQSKSSSSDSWTEKGTDFSLMFMDNISNTYFELPKKCRGLRRQQTNRTKRR